MKKALTLSRLTVLATAALVVCTAPADAQLALQWIVPAAANTPGAGGTYWRTDLSLHNPQPFDLDVWVQFLPTDSENSVADTLYLRLYPYETFNFWDVIGSSDAFATRGSGALLVFADPGLPCDPVEECDFLVTSRTYTTLPAGGVGEYGQTIPGASLWQGVDGATLGYASGILNDGVGFRANVGVASWSAAWTDVVIDVQSAEGNILDSILYQVPPFGHVQERLPTEVEGGTVVFYLETVPQDPLIFGYVSVVNQATGDASFQLAQPSTIGFLASKGAKERADRRSVPAASVAKQAAGRVVDRRSRTDQ
jgi:hypothetical protein